MWTTWKGRRRRIDVRRITGIVSILIMFLGIFASYQKTDPGEYQYKFTVLLSILVIIWFISSLLNKILMIVNIRSRKLIFLSLACFVLFCSGAIIFGTRITPYQRPVIYEFFMGLWIIGWPIIDALDLRFYLL